MAAQLYFVINMGVKSNLKIKVWGRERTALQPAGKFLLYLLLIHFLFVRKKYMFACVCLHTCNSRIKYTDLYPF